MRLTDKVSIITGGGRIGHATALKFAAEGAKVAVCDINQAAVDDTVREILASAGKRWGSTSTSPTRKASREWSTASWPNGAASTRW